MKKQLSHLMEASRQLHGRMGTPRDNGPQGAFIYTVEITGGKCIIIADDGRDWVETGLPLPVWEHVSVSMKHRCPKWTELEEIKREFWDDQTVMQLHVPSVEHVNNAETCLHLWRPIGIEIPRPPQNCV